MNNRLPAFSLRHARPVAMVAGPAPADGVEGAAQRAQEALRRAEAECKVDAMLARRRAAQAREVRRSASPPKEPDGQCSCGEPGCTAYIDFPADSERSAYASGREIVRGGGYVVGIR
jgi:hypothetical protein